MKQIVAAEVSNGGLQLYFHNGNSFRMEEVPFSPFVLAGSDAVIPGDPRIETLSGSNFFCRIAFFDHHNEYFDLLPQLKKIPGVETFSSLEQQALSINDLHLFEDVEFSGLRQLYFSIEKNNDCITAVHTADSTGSSRLFTGDETETIRQFAGYINAFDPDVLAGFNCCREDLPLLVKRAKKLKIKLTCGRDGEGFTMRQSRYTAGEKQYSYQKYTLAGRHVIDLLHPVQFYDAVHRDLEELELSSLKDHFQLSGDTAAELQRELAAILLPAYFYRTRILPLNFQESIMRGSGSALDALLTAKYLQMRRSIPLPEVSRPYAGAISSMEIAGVFHRVRHCDVRSLYPSLLLHFNQSPARDEAGIFLQLLDELRTFRLTAKDRARQLPAGPEKQQQESLQSSFKILINSFYGYLGFAQGGFNDFDLAEKITAAGRELLSSLIRTLEANGAVVIEADTDGIYFQPPEDERKNQLEEQLNAVLPSGIQLEFDAEYPAMFSYKAKNYALLTGNGTIHLTGAALKSRALEPFQRKFIREIVSGLLHDDPAAIEKSYRFWHDAIEKRTLPLEELAKSEVLSDSPENYRKKLAAGTTRRSAPYELALASGKNFRAGDRIKFYVTGTKAKLPVVGNSRLLDDAQVDFRDENTAYYLAKLDSLVEMFNISIG